MQVRYDETTETTTTSRPPNRIGGAGVSATVIAVPNEFISKLTQSGNRVFEAVAESLHVGEGADYLSRLNNECSALGL